MGYQEWILGEWILGSSWGTPRAPRAPTAIFSRIPRGREVVSILLKTLRFRTISGLWGSSRSQGCQEWVLECQEWILDYQCLPAVTSCPLEYASACQAILQYNLSTCMSNPGKGFWMSVPVLDSSIQMFSGACQCLPAAFTWTRFPFPC